MVSSRITFAAAFAATFMLTPAFAANVIHFTGQVVEDPCVITPQSHNISMSCPLNDKMRTRQVSYTDAVYGAMPFADRATMKMKYLNPEKSLAVLQVDYR